MIADIDAPEPAEEKINAYLAAHAADVDGIVTTAWVPAVVAANALRRIGDKRIKMVGIDHDEVVLKAIKDGFVARHHAAEPLRPGLYRLLRRSTGCATAARSRPTRRGRPNALTNHFIDSGTVFVGADKVDNYVAAMQDITKTLLAGFEKTYLNCAS